MDAYQRFHQLLKRDFAPVPRADGFKGSGAHFRRVEGERIDAVNVQGSRYGGRCCVNLGVHFTFLPSEGGRAVDPKTLKEYECVFRSRLHEAGEADRWWDYGDDDVATEASAASLVDTYKRRAARFFDKFEPFPDVFERVAPADIGGGARAGVVASLAAPKGALTMARVMSHLGHREKCREFAEAGLRHLGVAVGLKAELERLRDGDR